MGQLLSESLHAWRCGAHALLCTAALWWASCASHPPYEAGPFRPDDLVEIVSIDPSVRLDIRYATKNNFFGRPVYSEARAFLQRPAAEALARANRRLHRQGYGLTVFDGYRPWTVTKLFWDEASSERRGFVADPKKGSRHNRGCAVDLTLHDLATGLEVKMPSEYDEASERSYASYVDGPAEALRLRDMLRAAMEAEEFSVLQNEWWHYDFNGWKEYRLGQVPFSQIKQGRPSE